MDTKALAKSKRAHSLQHSKKKPSNVRQHQNQGTTTSTSGSSDAGAKLILNKHDMERARQSRLPSNWDRYDEDVDLDTEGNFPSSLLSASNVTDIVVPKSKGADYRHLISEARSQSVSQQHLSNSLQFDCFPSLHDVLGGEFHEGVASMLSTRGEGIQSWISDDNFVVGDERASTREESFLSLNLHALAKQLEKVDLSESLFIEPDFLPSDLSGQGSVTNQEYEPTETHQSSATKTTTQTPTIMNQKTEVISSDSAVNNTRSVCSGERTDILGQKGNNVYQGGRSSQERGIDPPKQIYAGSVPSGGEKIYTFEAATAEAELDMLLDSFSENTSLPSDASPVSGKVAPTHHGANSSISKPVTANLDDILDDLLNQPLEVKPTPKEKESSSQSITKSKLMDDFDSWLDTI